MSSDRDEWATCWEVHGIRADDGLTVSVRVGVIDLDGQHTVAISVADKSRVALTDRLTDDAKSSASRGSHAGAAESQLVSSGFRGRQ